MSVDDGLAAAPTAGWLQSSRGRAFRALAHREFRLVWGTFVVGQLGFWIAFLAMQALMNDLTDSDGTWLGLLFFTNFIPLLLFTPFAGVVADRYDRKRQLTVGYVALTIVPALLAVLAFTDNVTPPLLLPFAFATGTVFAFNAPASQTLTAAAVPPADLPSAVSLVSVGSNLSRVVGPTIAAPILALTDEDVAFVLYAATSLVVVVLLAVNPLSTPAPAPEEGSFFERLKGGWEHAKERPPAVAALLLLAVSSLTAGAYFSILPLIAEDTFDKGSSGLTTLAAVSGIGSVIGAIATGMRDISSSMWTTTALVAAFGATFVVFGLAPTWGLLLAASVVMAAFYFWSMTNINALLQQLADDNKRGRLMALFIVGWGGLVPIGALWQGAVAEAFGVRTAVVTSGLIVTAYALVTMAVTRGRAPAVSLRSRSPASGSAGPPPRSAGASPPVAPP